LIALAWQSIDAAQRSQIQASYSAVAENMPFGTVWLAAEASGQRLSDRHAPPVARALAGLPGEDAAEMAMVGEAASQGHL